jgi:hypothetical protein
MTPNEQRVNDGNPTYSRARPALTPVVSTGGRPILNEPGRRAGLFVRRQVAGRGRQIVYRRGAFPIGGVRRPSVYRPVVWPRSPSPFPPSCTSIVPPAANRRRYRGANSKSWCPSTKAAARFSFSNRIAGGAGRAVPRLRSTPSGTTSDRRSSKRSSFR